MVGPLPKGNGGVTYPSPNEFPVTYIAVTGITKGPTTLVTAVGHGITLPSSQSSWGVDFSFVKGMEQINGKFGYVLAVPTLDTLIVGIDSSNFSSYSSGGFINKITGPSPYEPFTNTF